MKGYKHLTRQEKATILRLYRKHGSTTIVRELTGLTKDKIRLLLKKYGIDVSHSRGPVGVCYRNQDLIRQMLANGESNNQIARTLCTNTKCLRKFLQVRQIDYDRFRQTGANNPFWRGGVSIEHNGKYGKYRKIFRPDHPQAQKNRHPYIREHRLVAEKILGRYLTDKEVVHHVNGNGLDNRPENLMVFASNGDHLRYTNVKHGRQLTGIPQEPTLLGPIANGQQSPISNDPKP